MFGIPSAGPRRSGRAPLLLARALLALLCLLSVVGGPSPVLCLESDGGCAREPLADSRPASCHDQEPAPAAGCESCRDVAAPEESLLGANRVHHALYAPLTTSGTARLLVADSSSGAHRSETLLVRPDPLLSVRTTVLLI